MVQIEFDNNKIITIIQANLEDPFQDVISKYLEKTKLSSESVSFLSNGPIINQNLTVEKLMNDSEKDNKSMKVVVKIIKEDENERRIIKSKEIICPLCHEPCRIKLENCKVKLYDCINGHVQENINLIDFDNTQKIDLSKIVCYKCKDNNKSNTFNNEFYVCLNCKQNLCPICKSKHEQENNDHNIIKYDQKFFICPKHNDSYTSYCEDCKQNLCFLCVKEHKEHKNISFNNIIPDVSEIKERLIEIKKL